MSKRPPEPMTYEALLKLARAAKGRELETVTGKRFTVGVYRDGPFFTPASSGYGQADGRKAMERFIEHYNESGSLRPGDYVRLTRNASYFIGLLLAADEIRSEAESRARRLGTPRSSRGRFPSDSGRSRIRRPIDPIL